MLRWITQHRRWITSAIATTMLLASGGLAATDSAAKPSAMPGMSMSKDTAKKDTTKVDSTKKDTAAAAAAPVAAVPSDEAGPGAESAVPLAPIDPGPELDSLEHRAWRAFLSKHARVARKLEADLLARSDLPLAEFDVLFQLALSDEHRLRMNELADRVVLSRAGITRLVDRLVADGLVTRLRCASDARGYFAVLTARQAGSAELGLCPRRPGRRARLTGGAIVRPCQRGARSLTLPAGMSRSPIPTRSTFPGRATPRATWSPITWPWPTARCGGPADGPWPLSVTSTAPRASSSSRSVRPSRGPSGCELSSWRSHPVEPPTR